MALPASFYRAEAAYLERPERFAEEDTDEELCDPSLPRNADAPLPGHPHRRRNPFGD